MKVHRQLDYAIVGLHALYNHAGASVNEIAEQYDLPRHFLAKTFQKLKKVGLLTSRRGVQGGYEFKRPLNQISFVDFYEAICGPLVTNHCLETKGVCAADPRCPMFNIRHMLATNLQQQLRPITLDRIIEKNAFVPQPLECTKHLSSVK